MLLELDWNLHEMSERLCPLAILLKAYHVRLFETDYRYISNGHVRPRLVDGATRAVRKTSRIRYNYLRGRARLQPVTDWTIDPGRPLIKESNHEHTTTHNQW